MKWFAALVLPLALLALVVACEEEEEEAAITTPSPAATVTATPQATPTAEPTSEPTLEPTPTPALSEGDESENLATQVYRYGPSVPDDVLPPNDANDCWTASIASNRSDAYRCRLGDFIYDPCFSIGVTLKKMVCPGDPRTPIDDVAFTFDVSTVPVDPYRGPARVKSGDNVWFMVVNGQGCYAVTGTLPGVGQKFYEFSCFGTYCTKPVQGLQGFVSDCWNPDTGEEKPYTLDAVWY